MPNWCSTAYAIDGDAKEVRQLYELMKGLEERDSPSVKNDFGTTWLGCLVDALGGDWKKIKCRGDWSFLELDEDDDIVRFCTETAWYPCNEVLEFVCKKFPSLNYYCQAEEPGQNIYITNDKEGKYFYEKYLVDIYTPDKKCHYKYFSYEKEMYAWFEQTFATPIKSEEDVREFTSGWNGNAYCYIRKFELMD